MIQEVSIKIFTFIADKYNIIISFFFFLHFSLHIYLQHLILCSLYSAIKQNFTRYDLSGSTLRYYVNIERKTNILLENV